MARSPKTPDTTITTTKPEAKPVGSPPVTFDVNDPAFQAILAQAVAVALAAEKAERIEAAKATALNGKSEQSIKNEIQTVRAFKKIGIKATPHVDTFTFNKWVSMGLRPKEGSR